MNSLVTQSGPALLMIGLCLACRQPVSPSLIPRTQPSYFAGYTVQSNPIDRNKSRVMVSRCDTEEPTDLLINVYTFSPETNADEALASITHSGSLPVSPTERVSIRAKYTNAAGAWLSDYDPEKRFPVDVERDTVLVLTTETQAGTKLAAWVITTNKTVEKVCLSIL